MGADTEAASRQGGPVQTEPQFSSIFTMTDSASLERARTGTCGCCASSWSR